MRQTIQYSPSAGRYHETTPMGGLVIDTYTAYDHVYDLVMSKVVVKR